MKKQIKLSNYSNWRDIETISVKTTESTNFIEDELPTLSSSIIPRNTNTFLLHSTNVCISKIRSSTSVYRLIATNKRVSITSFFGQQHYTQYMQYIANSKAVTK